MNLLIAMRRDVNDEPLRLQAFPDKGGDFLFVFDEQDFQANLKSAD